jgi:hypothetical protein
MITFSKSKASRIALLIAAGMAAASGGARQTNLGVSVTVPPKAVLQAVSPTSVWVGVTMYPKIKAQVWPGKTSCSSPQKPTVISASGISTVTFTTKEVTGTSYFCLKSSDGLLSVSIPRPH